MVPLSATVVPKHLSSPAHRSTERDVGRRRLELHALDAGDVGVDRGQPGILAVQRALDHQADIVEVGEVGVLHAGRGDEQLGVTQRPAQHLGHRAVLRHHRLHRADQIGVLDRGHLRDEGRR
jgi:hypothetical protein